MEILKIFIPFTFFLISCISQEGKQLKSDNQISGTVIKIVDGDTFDILTQQNQTIRIRMNGIDCPEKKQDYYSVAKTKLGDYIFNKVVEIITFGKDRYKRTIANVFVDNKNINVAMVRNGYAWHYKKYSTDPILAEAEKEARLSKRGLWAKSNPIPPWEFRHK